MLVEHDPPKAPMPLNYGIEEARFTEPVYPGASLRCHPERSRRVTVKASSSRLSGNKVDQEKRTRPAAAGKPKTADSQKGADIPTGIVKFLIDVVDETGETVAIATILTMVRKLVQN